MTFPYIIGVSSKFHHPSKYEQSHSITDESKGCTPSWLLSPHLWSEPLVSSCREVAVTLRMRYFCTACA